MSILLLTRDLMVNSEVSGVASRAGRSLQVVGDVAAALHHCERDHPQLVIVDLASPGIEIKPLVAALRNSSESLGAIVAFGPHVHTSLLADAQAAGCNQVLTRGSLGSGLAELLEADSGEND